jgi:excisionase family DNA binding protein
MTWKVAETDRAGSAGRAGASSTATSESASSSEDSLKQVFTVSEAADVLGISRTLAYDLVAKGQLPAIRLGRRIVVPAQALGALLSAASSGAG